MRDADRSHLFPPFATLLEKFEAELQRANLPFYLFEGLRSHEQQAEYFAQGRTTPGKIITWAMPGNSFHQYGMGADYVLDVDERPGTQWSWDIKKDLNADGRSDWEQMAEIARQCGLESGWFWRMVDAPHIQCRYGLTVFEAQEFYKVGGLPAVWRAAQDWLEDNMWP
jgi:peptidoglycan L-alanyl-D-glutamate endopeptidase CwlK